VNYSILKLVGEVTACIFALVYLAWISYKAGEKIDSVLGRKARYTILVLGMVLILALNSGFIHNLWLAHHLLQLNLTYFVAFMPFCYGMRPLRTA